MSGDLWTPKISHKAGFLETPACPFCGHALGDQFHLMWHCPASAAERFSDERVRQLIPQAEALPKTLAELGWAPALHADPTGPYWGRDLASTDEYPTGFCGTQTTTQITEQNFDTLAQAILDQDVPNTTAERFID